MSDDPKVPDDSVIRAQRIDQICDVFESAWSSGQRPRLEDALTQFDPAEHDQLLRELLPIDIFHRVKSGDQPLAAEYISRFPLIDHAWIEQSLAQAASQPPPVPPKGP